MFEELEKKSQEKKANAEDIFQETDKVEGDNQSLPPSVPKDQLKRMKSKGDAFSTDKYRPYRAPVSSGAKRIRIIVIVLVILAALGFGIYYMYTNLLKTDENLENNLTPISSTSTKINNEEANKPKIEEPIIIEEPEIEEPEIEEPVIIEEPEPEFVNLDPDGDGLTTAEEVGIYNTNPNNPDTDNDGLSDGDEVNIYNTDPLNDDSDGDTYLDGLEVKSGYNPLGDGEL